MAKKMLVGVVAVFIALALAQAGYSFGKHLAKKDGGDAKDVATAASSAT